MYVAGTCRVAQWMLRPPEEEEREAFSHSQSGRGLPTRSDTASHIKPSKEFRVLRMRAGGQQRRMNANLGRERQDRRRAVS